MRVVRKHWYYPALFLAWAVLLFYVFRRVLSGELNVSVTNLMYYAYPWDARGIGYTGRVLSDPVDSWLPMVWQMICKGNRSLWNPMNALGYSQSVDIIMNPMSYIFKLPMQQAQLVFITAKISVAYFGMAYFLRRLRLTPVARIFGAVVFSTGSAMMMWNFWPHTNVIMLLPLLFALGHRLMEKHRVLDMLLLSLCVYLMIVANMPAYAGYCFYLFGFWILFTTIWMYRQQRKDIFRVYFAFGGSFVIGALAAVPYILNIYQQTMANGYIDGRKGKSLFTMDTLYLRTFVAPFKQTDLKVTLVETCGFVGTAVLLLLPFLFIGFRRKKQLFWIVSSLVIGLFLYSRHLDFIFSRMPLINSSLKSRLVSILPFTLVVLAAIQLDDVIKHGDRYRRYFWRYALYALGIGFAGFVAYRYPEQPRPNFPVKVAVTLFVGMELIVLFAEKGKNGKTPWFEKLTQKIADRKGEGSFGADVLRLMRPWLRLIAGGVLLSYTVIQMGIFARDNMFYIEKRAPVIPEATEGIYHLQESQPNRVYAYAGWTFFPNSNVFYDVKSFTVHGFVSTNPDLKYYEVAVDNMMLQSSTQRLGMKIDHYPLLKYAGVDTLFTREPLGTEEENGYNLYYYAETDRMHIFKTNDYSPRFFLGETVVGSKTEHDSILLMKDEYVSGRVYLSEELTDADLIGRLNDAAMPLAETEGIDIIKDETDRITLKVKAETERILVFNEYNDGNWKVYLDGKRVQDIKSNYLFNGVTVPAGEHEVKFVYDPPGIRKTLPISFGILILTIALTVFLGIRELRNRKNKPADTSAGNVEADQEKEQQQTNNTVETAKVQE